MKYLLDLLSKFLQITLLLSIFITLAGCRISPESSAKNAREKVEQLSTAAGFEKSRVKTQAFILTTYQKFASNTSSTSNTSSPSSDTQSNKSLTIYIEGDGHPRISRTKASADPTPLNPLALKLALLDPDPNVAYLARPCQYTPHSENSACIPAVWGGLRFSEMVIANMNQAVDALKVRAKAHHIHLIGFSGGAAVAVLIAARRDDIVSIRTVAGDLDHVALSRYHRTNPLLDSLNPKAAAYQVAQIPQLHFSGEKDRIVPAFIAEDFVDEVVQSGGRYAKKYILKGAGHHDGWEKAWPELLQVSLTKNKPPKDRNAQPLQKQLLPYMH